MRVSRSSLTPNRTASRHRHRAVVEPQEDRQLLASLVALNTSNELLFLSSTAPGTILLTVPVTGLQAGETLLGIDARPATGQIYGLGSTSRLYMIDGTGAATQVGTSTLSTALNGADFGFDFNPVPDRIRVASNADHLLG